MSLETFDWTKIAAHFQKTEDAPALRRFAGLLEHLAMTTGMVTPPKQSLLERVLTGPVDTVIPDTVNYLRRVAEIARGVATKLEKQA